MKWIALTVSLFAVATCVQRAPPDEDVGKSAPELIQTRGYPVESHYVTTEDGYILTMFRIPSGKNGKSTGNRPPVILQHGLLDSSITFVNNYDYQSLGYILADNGLDVWFGNNRGNRYSRNHTTLDPDARSGEFWQFTFDEMAQYDVPAEINYVLGVTGYSTLSWIGHSQGTVQMFAASSSLEAYKDNVNFQKAIQNLNLFIGLAPVAYGTNMQSEAFAEMTAGDATKEMYAHGKNEYMPDGRADAIEGRLCQLVNNICDVAIMALFGPTRNINATRVQVYLSQFPVGTSTMDVLHAGQMLNITYFSKYDYGSAELNQKHYGADTPPHYDISKVAVKTALFYGTHDYLADPVDVQRIIDELPAENLVYVQKLENYAHMDFTWGLSAHADFYPKVMSLLKEYADK